MPEKLIWIE